MGRDSRCHPPVCVRAEQECGRTDPGSRLSLRPECAGGLQSPRRSRVRREGESRGQPGQRAGTETQGPPRGNGSVSLVPWTCLCGGSIRRGVFDSHYPARRVVSRRARSSLGSDWFVRWSPLWSRCTLLCFSKHAVHLFCTVSENLTLEAAVGH